MWESFHALYQRDDDDTVNGVHPLGLFVLCDSSQTVANNRDARFLVKSTKIARGGGVQRASEMMVTS
jgi:hypothetical protein